MNEDRPRLWRLFIAVTPPPAIQSVLGRLQANLGRRLPARTVKWAPPSQMHLTLRFLGDVPVTEVDDVLRAVVRVGVGRPPFELTLEGVGAFPDNRWPRVLWAGVGGALTALNDLHAAVLTATAAWGPPDSRPFHAHLTLGRVRDLSPTDEQALGQAWAGFSVGRLGAWSVERAELFRSQLRVEGAVHTRLE